MKKSSYRPLLSLVLSLAAVAGSAPARAADLDLTSTARTVPASSAISSPAAIMVGGNARVIRPGDTVTPAEFVALNQVVNTGAQRLGVNNVGQAAGGSFAVNGLPASILSGLLVPTGVTAIHDFSANNTLNFSNNLVNSGNFFAVSTNAANATANISAANIINNLGGLLTSVLQPGLLATYPNAISNLGLNLTAANDIVNSGTISSAGVIHATAGGVINNTSSSSLIEAVQNVSLSADKIISSGTVRAVGGSIDVAALNQNVSLRGGNWLSSALNVSAPNKVNINIGQVDGMVNVTAKELHIAAASDVLQLGKICLEGDPTFFNSVGDIYLNSGFDLTTGGADLAIVARASIYVNGATPISIDTRAAGDGGDIFLMAGADFTVIPNNTTFGDNDTTHTISITGGTAQGGKIDLTTGPGIALLDASSLSGNGTGGGIDLYAYGGSSAGAGQIVLPTSLTVRSNGTGTGHAGLINVSSGSTDPNQTAISIGDIEARGGGGYGAVLVQTNTFAPEGGGAVSITDGVRDKLFQGGTASQGSVSVGLISVESSNIAVRVYSEKNLTLLGIVANDDGFGPVFDPTIQSNGTTAIGSLTLPHSNLKITNIGSAWPTAIFPIEAESVVMNMNGGRVDLAGITAVGEIKISQAADITSTQPLQGSSLDLSSNKVGAVGTSANPVPTNISGSMFLSYPDGSIFVSNAQTAHIAPLSQARNGTNDAFFVEAVNGDVVLPDGYLNNPAGNAAGRSTQITLSAPNGNIVTSANTKVWGGPVSVTALGDIGSISNPLRLQGTASIRLKLDVGGDAYIDRLDGGASTPSFFDVELATVGPSGSANITSYAPGQMRLGLNGQISGLFAAGSSFNVVSAGPIEVRGQLIPTNGSSVALLSTGGDIKLSTNTLGPAIVAGNSVALTLGTTGGGVLINAPITMGNGVLFAATGSSNVDINANISSGAGTVIDINSINGNVNVGANVTTSINSSIEIDAGGNIANAINGGLLEAPSIELSANGNIGTSTWRLAVKTDSLNISADRDSKSFLTSQPGQGLTLGAINGGSVDIVADNGMTTTQAITVENLKLTATNNDLNINHMLTAQQKMELVTLNPVASVNVGPTGQVRGTDTVSITTNNLVNENVISGFTRGEVSVSSLPDGDLKVSGDGSITGDTINFTATPGTVTSTNTIRFLNGTRQTLNGDVRMFVNGDSHVEQDIRPTLEGDAQVDGSSGVTIYGAGYHEDAGASFNFPAGIKIVSPKGFGVISSSGDLLLKNNITLAGHGLALIAKGNITAASSFNTINMSNKTGQGGSVTMIAGHEFSTTGATPNDSAYGTIYKNFGQLYKIGGPSTTGGSILMKNVAINTSSADGVDSQEATAGDVTAVAAKGSINAGVVMLKSVNASSMVKAGHGGDVTLIGEGGVSVGDIDTSGGIAGNVTVLGARPTITNGEMIIQDGYMRTGATFTGQPTSGAGAAITTGNIKANGIHGAGGNINVESDAKIQTKGLFASSKTVDNTAVSGNGGYVDINSTEDQVIVGGDIVATGANAPGLNSSENGGQGGQISIGSPSLIQVNGLIDVSGGTSKGSDGKGSGDGGAGGAVYLRSNRTVFVPAAGKSFATAEVYVTKYIDATGGNAGTGKGGKGGDVSLDGATVRITGQDTTDDFYGKTVKTGFGTSIDTTYGNGATVGVQGRITIQTYALQQLPTRFDLEATEKTEYVQPGGMFLVKGISQLPAGEPLLNGVAGTVKNNPTSTSFARIKDNNDFLNFNGNGIYIYVHGSEINLNGQPNTQIIDSNNARVKVTPAAAVALYALTHGAPTQTVNLDADGTIASGPSNFTVADTDLRGQFSKFNLQSGSTFVPSVFGPFEVEGTEVVMNVTGTRPTIDVSKVTSNAPTIYGALNFTTPNARAHINMGKWERLLSGTTALRINPGRITTTGNSQIVLQSSGKMFENNGHITTGSLLVVPTASTFTYLNSSQFGITAASGASNLRIVVPATGKLATLTFQNNFNGVGSETGGTNLPLSFEDTRLGLAFGKPAEDSLPMPSNTRNVNVTFKYGQAEGKNVATVGGYIEGATITIKALINKPFLGAGPFVTAGRPTALTLQDAEIWPLTGALTIAADANAYPTSTADQRALKQQGRLTLMDSKIFGFTSVGLAATGEIAINDSYVSTYKNDVTVKSLEGGVSSTGGADFDSFYGAVSFEGKGPIAMDGLKAASGTKLTLKSSGTPNLECSQCGLIDLFGATNLLGRTGVEIRGNAAVELGGYVQAGFGKAPAGGASGVINATKANAFWSTGKIEIIAGNSTKTSPEGSVNLDANTILCSYGGDVKVQSWKNDIIFSNPVSVVANGGNVTLIAGDTIHDTNNAIFQPLSSTIRARSYGTTAASSVGGGIEFVTGGTSSTNLVPSLGKKGTEPKVNLGSFAASINLTPNDGTSGIVKVFASTPTQLSDGVNLSHLLNQPANLDLSGGAIVFTIKNTTPTTPTIFFDGINLQVYSLKGVAEQSETVTESGELIVDTEFDSL